MNSKSTLVEIEYCIRLVDDKLDFQKRQHYDVAYNGGGYNDWAVNSDSMLTGVQMRKSKAMNNDGRSKH